MREDRDGGADRGPTGASLDGLERRTGGPAYDGLSRLRAARTSRGVVTPADERAVADEVGLPLAAVHGAASYYADLRGRQGTRHVRVCAGTACFVAGGGGRHLTEVSRALGVPAGECTVDGRVSLQVVHCLGYCYTGPAALDGDQPRAGADLAAQLAGAVPPRPAPEPVVRAATPPIVLRGVVGEESSWQVWSRILAAVRSDGGPAAVASRIRAEVATAGLRGRGGAGFPTVHKWRAVAGSDVPPAQRYVVANGDEGDPGSFADRVLMEEDPERVLEGLALAALACGAERGFVYVRSEYPRAFDRLREAVERAYADGRLGEDLYGSGVRLDVAVVAGAGSYLAGEETSLLRSLAGLRATVRPRPPYPTDYGLLGRPTALNNVETLAAVPAVVAEGGRTYATRGVPPETGTLLVCLNERFRRPGLYEVELGTPLRDIVLGLGGSLAGEARLRALQVGGPLGGFLGPDQLDLPLLGAALVAADAPPGHGSLVAVDDRVDPRDLLRALWEFGARESCGTCTPCREGTRLGERRPEAAARDDSLLDTMELASLCPFGTRLPAVVRSLRRVYAEELS
ncbi:NAD(P)H-dependent oxidoreductase subunit E [Actinopolymorpha sp. NPDC004070]|uniref:NAD(P)H-dependent oxidoreductase subunit E n=1 Tax=Actinopolymorpha sp. NPDC004070 TaxID=3154548 RepID=UPI0033A14C1A